MKSSGLFLLLMCCSILQVSAQSVDPCLAANTTKVSTPDFKAFTFPEYPSLARIAHIENTVEILINTDFQGNVNNVHFCKGMEQLRASVLKAAAQWRFPEKLQKNIRVAIQFKLSETCIETTYKVTNDDQLRIVIESKFTSPPITSDSFK
ncbi:energy transducer TonB [Geothrix sp.]|uniref:energy transducer TonB n=1 Tax=Geothrix sp. TaxID=1962974 RepID=UPI00262238B1|nr:energy transducer TonB [Geothrix sp.]WIL19445.1 MAG: energy transducer TonB [Geothrix sp.]